MKEQWVIGIHAVRELLQQDSEVQRLYIQSGRHDKRIDELVNLAAAGGIPVEKIPRNDLDQLVNGRHQGVAARAVFAESSWHEQDLRQLVLQLLQVPGHDPLLLVLDEVTDPHNLGACLRSADAAGVDAVIVPKDHSAPLNMTVRKVASGAAETVPLVAVTNLNRTLKELKEQGIWLCGTAGEAEKSLYQQDLTGPLALVMGSEGKGMRRLTQEACDFLVAIPMAGRVSSLNVSVAAGVCLFEAVRQRRP
ncbi:MAG: 23S rRNA (guanosine(2251)-2'-O)-methyltransferase RlmB [Gammaproteobacteria bacterium]|nr:23S rRNA (guanosine(2251)-2'-O)-methyltransferase RlmB [Gammaproteobacteria bacterium]